LASSFTLLLPPSELSVEGAGVEVLAELVVGVSAAVLAEEELDDELPQPASTSSAAGSASSENRAFERIKILQ
jgi:hypothetical protein